MEREILNLKEYDLIPLIDEYWNERDEYCVEDDDGENCLDVSGEWNNYELIETILDYYDLEDGYEVNNHIIKRSDGKYFKFYSKYTYCDNIIIPKQEIKEVFPKEKTIIVYE